MVLARADDRARGPGGRASGTRRSARKPPTSGLAVVLGGGGATGVAYSCGALRALAEVAGVDAATADVLIGTSAGAVVAADLRTGRSYDEMMESAREDAEGAQRRSVMPAWRSVPDLMRRLIGSTWVMSRSALPLALRTPEPPGFLQRAFPGSLFLFSDTTWASDRYPVRWPERPLWAVAFDLEAGRRVVLARSAPDGIFASLPQAVEASCAVPGLYAPVRVGGRRLVDGGVQSVTNLDLAVRTRCRTVIALSPMGFEPGRPPNHLRMMARQRFNNQLRGEAAAVRRSGASLLHLRPTGDDLQHHGLNMLSLAGNDQVMRAAYESTARRLETSSAQRVLATVEPRRSG